MEVTHLIINGEWGGDDFDALKFLESQGIIQGKGGWLHPPYWPFEETVEISAAINYLAYEWDFNYGPQID